MKKDLHLLWIVIPFFFFLLVFLGASVLLPDYAYSPEEGRSLAQRPAIVSKDLTAAAENWSDYVVDQFPLRSRFLKAFSAVELAQGKKLPTQGTNQGLLDLLHWQADYLLLLDS